MFVRRTHRLTVLAILCCGFSFGVSGLRAGDSDRLRNIIKDEHAQGTDLWIYNDLAEAKAQARRERKPIFVTFRCVPCEACSGFDASVAKGSERIEKLARESFVSVRQVEMKGVDLSQFQFDYDLNWAAMFINFDGVVYGRYGTQSVAGPDAYNSIEALEKTMLRVLKLHEAYPRNTAELKGKRGAKKPYRTALEMPGLENKEQRRGPTARNNCIHCHNIHDAEQMHAQDSGTFTTDLLWRYPLPENIGLVIASADGVRIEKVTNRSPAARANLRAGEAITHLGGQAITSIADMQWVLHHLPNTATELTVRGRESGLRTLRLEAGWKKSDISWRGSIWGLRPRLRVWMPPLKDKGRRDHGIPDGESALEVKWINDKTPGGRAARSAGLRYGDIVVALAGKPFNMPGRVCGLRLLPHRLENRKQFCFGTFG